MPSRRDWFVTNRFMMVEMSLRSWLGLEPEAAPAAETDSVRKVVAALDELPPERARYVAAFGYILGRVANADLEISAEETAAMERLCASHGKIPVAQAVVVVQMAKTSTQLFGGTENFLVTREFRRIATREQCLELLDCLFAVSAARAKPPVPPCDRAEPSAPTRLMP